MNKKTVLKIRKAICVISALLLAFSCFSVCGFAEESYISAIAVSAGENAAEKLEENDYTVMFQGMNLVTDSDSMVFLGYKKGTDAITDIIVSESSSQSLTVGSVNYTLASEVNLNYGTSGTPLYLYYTKDKAAGEGITSLDTVSGFADTDDVYILKNDGSSPARMQDGKAANLDDGINDNELYLLMYRGGTVKQYISDAAVVRGSSAVRAVQAAADAGCDCYLDYDLDSGSSVTYIAYRRSSAKSDALTKITFDGTDLKKEKNADAAAFLIDISADKLFSSSFTLGEWAGIYAASDSAVSRSSSQFRTLLSSEDKCSCVCIGGIYALYLGTVSGDTAVNTEAAVTETAGETSSAAEDLTDEFAGISKEDTAEESTEADETVSASVFGSGKAGTVLIFVLIIIAAAAVFVIFRKRGKRDNEKDT